MPLRKGYGQFCPVAMATEILGSRWTILLLRELLAGSARFNDLRRGLPRMSPALLSRRLKELEEAAIVQRVRLDDGGQGYRLTAAGEELRGIVESIGNWGQRWVETEATLKNLDPSLLMWDMRRRLDPRPLPAQRSVIQFLYSGVPKQKQRWWLVIDDGEVDLCWVDPGHDVDLFVQTDPRTMTMIWMGLSTLRDEVGAGRVQLTGSADLERSMHQWLGYSPFAVERKRPDASARP